ncbi:glutathione peroxidase [Fodinibius salsisoli]|uniref:Glutathione peroxidase n=1 Tax=Fodinibius salsisoli TaxID=2820877 RepID=A0ABT3PII9_9BACT|nr:glutathione peroxidase [Fodinibius salsisoli]MCW9705742.1 glutathione peroxidase [Fodinibius salsisoli]
MKTLGLLIIFSFASLAFMNGSNDSVYNYNLSDIDGEETSLGKYEGKVLLIVNTASECGFTPQYEGLQAIYEDYQDEGLVVLGFPANNFGGQEPGTEKEIKRFCKINYDVSFPMFSKVSVKGEEQHPLFKYLTTAQNPDFTGTIKWNFEKFLVDKNGKLIRRFRSDVEPKNNTILKAIESALDS